MNEDGDGDDDDDDDDVLSSLLLIPVANNIA